MPVRFRRKRILFVLFLSIWILTCLISYLDSIIENDDLIDIKSTTSSIVREEFIEINGTKLRKIDWHDYESIAREKIRTGILMH